MQTEERGEDQEEQALADGADGALGHRGEQQVRQIADGVKLQRKAEPGEVIIQKPDAQRLPVNGERYQHRNSVVNHGFPALGHLASNPNMLKLTPSSRCSFPDGGSVLSRAKVTTTASFVSAPAGTSWA